MPEKKFQIHVHTGGFAQTNAYLFQTGGGTILIDAPDGTVAWLGELEIKPDVLFLTHHHFDHNGEAAAVKEQFGIPIYAHSQYSPQLTLAELFSSFSGMDIQVPEFTVDIVLGDRQETLEIEGETFRTSHVPGHSQDSLCLYHGPSGNLFAGDTLMASSIGRCDLPGGSQRLLVEGIREKILTLPPDTVVHPGHGGQTTVGAEKTNPFLL